MSRSHRKGLAEETVAIVDRGSYTSAVGQHVEIGPAVRDCLEGTRYFGPEERERLRDEVLSGPPITNATAIEVVNETTLAGIARVSADGGGSVAALNFASARHPGGGFLNGSQAQEESLARSSALYASLLRAPAFYERYQDSSSLLYSDAVILSPHCPIFRDDDGRLLDEPCSATFLTCAAPNAGAIATNRPDETAAIPATLLRRSEFVLATAAAHGHRRLILGAWGCGVFRNDPDVVADAFATHLHGAWAGRFDRVVFSVFDPSAGGETFAAFRAAFAAKS